MGLTKYEQETIINFNEKERLASVYTHNPVSYTHLAAVLGAKERGQGYLQGNGYIVSWCVGHLIGLAAADSYDPKYSKWCYEDLPIIPKRCV